MGIELEAKIRVENHAPTRTRLQAAGAKRLGQFHEINRFFDTPAHTLRESGCGLRLRSSRNVDDGDTTHLLTYKGPRQPGRMKKREEIETAMENPSAAQLLLERLGYVESLTFEKTRESWMLDHCRIELDEVTLLGKFVEVEGPDEMRIDAVLRKLALDDCERVVESYPQLIARLNTQTS